MTSFHKYFFIAFAVYNLVACNAHSDSKKSANSVAIPESGMSYRAFRDKARAIARDGSFDHVILVSNESKIHIRIPVTDGDATTPWYPFIVNTLTKRKIEDGISIDKTEEFIYVIVRGKNLKDSKKIKLTREINKLNNNSKNKLPCCLVFVCAPNNDMEEIFRTIEEIKDIVGDRIAFIDLDD